MFPSEEVGVALVEETGDRWGWGLGSLAGIGLSETRMAAVVLNARRRSREGSVRRVEDSILYCR